LNHLFLRLDCFINEGGLLEQITSNIIRSFTKFEHYLTNNEFENLMANRIFELNSNTAKFLNKRIAFDDVTVTKVRNKTTNRIRFGGVFVKAFWIPLIASFGTMIFLYLIGFIGNIDFLIFKVSFSYTEISLLPIVIGILIGFISERIIKLKSR
jgi:hypothetical protein